jgi:asparagine synthetase B (glutamine-hydrolysing)
MCRILGASLANNDEKLDIAEIAALLFPPSVRQGPHAYGWMTYNNNGGNAEQVIETKKYVGRADTDDAWNNIIYGVDPKAQWLIGHTRFATHGDPKDLRNDHPIKHGKIIGVHNGVLRNHEDILAITGREDPKTQVDSEAIFAAVNKWGPTKGLRRVQGDMVAVYANEEKPHVVHIARTHGRQLTIGFTTKGNLIWASDQSTLKVLEPDIKFDHFTTISENRLVLVREGKIIQRYTFRKPAKPVHRFVPPPARIMVPTVRDHVSETRDVFMRAGDPELLDAYDRVVARRNARQGTKRGELLFPSSGRAPIVSKGKGKKGAGKKGKRSPNQNERVQIPEGDLHYFDGQLLSEADYREVIKARES